MQTLGSLGQISSEEERQGQRASLYELHILLQESTVQQPLHFCEYLNQFEYRYWKFNYWRFHWTTPCYIIWHHHSKMAARMCTDENNYVIGMELAYLFELKCYFRRYSKFYSLWLLHCSQLHNYEQTKSGKGPHVEPRVKAACRPRSNVGFKLLSFCSLLFDNKALTSKSAKFKLLP